MVLKVTELVELQCGAEAGINWDGKIYLRKDDTEILLRKKDLQKMIMMVWQHEDEYPNSRQGE